MEFVLLRTREQVASIGEAAGALINSVVAEPDATYTPSYFLPRLRSNEVPRVVVCREGGELVGLFYAHEILVFGFRTGFATGGDQMGRGLVVCAPEREQEIVSACCRFLLENGIHAMRLDWTPRGTKTDDGLSLRKDSVQLKVVADPRVEGDWLQLQPSYEQFLAMLGPHTRRNMRYYRRKVEAAGLIYTGALAPSDFSEALHSLNKLADYPMEPGRLARDRRYMATFGNPLIAGLRRANGEFVSLVTGFSAGNHLHILTQLNGEDDALRKLSLSLVLRGYLIEEFIHRGCTAVHFFQGSSPMLGRFCAPVDLRHIAIDDRSMLMTPFKQMCSQVAAMLQSRGRRVPYRLQWAAGSHWA